MNMFKPFILLIIGGQLAFSQIGSPDTDFLYARKLYDDKLYELAAQELSKFIRNYPTDSRIPDARYYSGLAYFNQQKFEQARRDFQFLAIDFPKDKRAPDAWQKVAECYAALGDYTGAANSMASIAAFYPNAPNAISSILLASDFFIKAGDLRSAKDKLEKLIADQPDIPEAHQSRLKLALLLRDENELNQASIEFQNVIDKAKDPELVGQATYEKGRIHEAMGRTDDARIAYEKVIARYSTSKAAPYALFEMGLMLTREKRYEEAQKMLESVASSIVPPSLKNAATINVGDILFMKGQYLRSGEKYRIVAEGSFDSVNSVEAYLKWGIALENQDKEDLALGRYLSIVREVGPRVPHHPMVPLAYLRLIENYVRLSQYKDAAELYDAFAIRFPDYPDMDRIQLKHAELVLSSLANPKDATYLLENLLREYPKTAFRDKIYFLLGRAYREQSLVSKAMENLLLVQNFPGSQYAAPADSEMNLIRLYYPDPSSETTARLLVLLGDVITGKPKDEVLFSYAKLYYQELKDYKKASELFWGVVEASRNKELIEEAVYFTAISYERLSARADSEPFFADSALSVYRRLTVGTYSDRAALYIVKSNIQRFTAPSDRALKRKESFTALLERYPGSRLRDEMLIELGRALVDLGEIVPKAVKRDGGKAIGSRSYGSAVDCFQEILKNPGSPFSDEAAYRLAVAYELAGDRSKYQSALEFYIQTFPRGTHVAENKYRLGQLREQQSAFSEAVLIYQDLIAHYAYTRYADSAAQGIGNNYLFAQEYDKAINAYEHALEMSKDPFTGIDIYDVQKSIHRAADYKRAYCYEKLNQTSKAIELYESYLYPDFNGAFALPAMEALAQIYDKKQDFPKALKYFSLIGNRFAETDAGFQALVRVAEVQFSAEQYDSSRVAYQKLLRLAKDPMKKMVFEARAIVCTYRLGQIQATTAYEKEFLKRYEREKNLRILMDNYRAEFQYELGRYYVYGTKQPNYELAYKTFARIVDEYKNVGILPDVFYEMGVIRFNEGKSQEGFALMQQIPQRYPNAEILPRVYLRLAHEAFRLEQPNQAIEFSKLALLNPNISRAEAKLGTDFLIKVFKAAGYYENALLLIQQYIDKFPDDDPANLFSKRIDIGVMHKNLKSFDRALQYFKDLIKVAGGEDEAEIQYNIADTYWAMNNFDQALLEYLRIPYLTMGKKFDWASAARSQAAECYVKLGKYPEAIRMYDEIIRTTGSASEYGVYSKQRIEQIRQLQKSP